MIISKRARKFLAKMGADRQQLLAAAIERIEADPFIGKCVQHSDHWSYRVGKLRVLYRQEPLEIVSMGTRGNIYKGLAAGKGSER